MASSKFHLAESRRSRTESGCCEGEQSYTVELRVLTNTLTIKHPTNADLFAVPWSLGPLGNLSLAAGGAGCHDSFRHRFPNHGAAEVARPCTDRLMGLLCTTTESESVYSYSSMEITTVSTVTPDDSDSTPTTHLYHQSPSQHSYQAPHRPPACQLPSCTRTWPPP